MFLSLSGDRRAFNLTRRPHMKVMAQWQASITRAPPKSKAELRQMLTEAVRNTQAETADGTKHPPKSKKEHG